MGHRATRDRKIEQRGEERRGMGEARINSRVRWISWLWLRNEYCCSFHLVCDCSSNNARVCACSFFTEEFQPTWSSSIFPPRANRPRYLFNTPCGFPLGACLHLIRMRTSCDLRLSRTDNCESEWQWCLSVQVVIYKTGSEPNRLEYLL